MDNPSFLRCSIHDPHLYETRDSHIFRCACCGRIQIEFRRRTLLMKPEEFESLFETLSGMFDGIEETGSEEWVLSVPTDVGEGVVQLKGDEIQELYDLLAGAQAMRSLEERIGAVAVGQRRERPPVSWRP